MNSKVVGRDSNSTGRWNRWTGNDSGKTKGERQSLLHSEDHVNSSYDGVENGTTSASRATTRDGSSLVQRKSEKLWDSLCNGVCDFCYPKQVPEEVQLFRLENMAIPACYLVVGTMQGLFRTFLNVYPIDIGASEAQQTTFSTIATLPAAFKLLYGFTSDNLPLLGYRRKPYLFLGWFFVSMIMMWLWRSHDLTLLRDEAGDAPSTIIVPTNAPSITTLSVSFFLFGVSMWFADATADALVAEKARSETEEARGSLQSTCYTLRFLGLMISAPVSTWLYSNVGPHALVQCLALIPIVMFPLSLVLKETKGVLMKTTWEHCQEIWRTVCLRSVWEPMGFIYLFNLLQVSNSAWRQYLVTVLGFTATQLNSLLVASYVLLYVGTMVYKYFFLHSSWRLIYQGSICLNALLSALQLLLIRGITFGIPPFLFALGDDAFAEFLNGIQFLPCAIMMTSLCPPGSEGASYSMFTTVWNSAQMISPALSTVLLGIWDVSKKSLEARELDGLFYLTLLTTVIQLSPIVFVHWLPHGRDDLEALTQKPWSGSALGGGTFLFVVFASMAWTLTISVMNIRHPGWAGGS